MARAISFGSFSFSQKKMNTVVGLAIQKGCEDSGIPGFKGPIRQRTLADNDKKS
ncbi:hypothetical protein ACFLZL_03565 [Thermodesulfobacteriota bacterium]